MKDTLDLLSFTAYLFSFLFFLSRSSHCLHSSRRSRSPVLSNPASWHICRNLLLCRAGHCTPFKLRLVPVSVLTLYVLSHNVAMPPVSPGGDEFARHPRFAAVF
jgi:hypothetical protein